MSLRLLFRTGVLIVAGQVVVALLGIAALRLYTELVPPTVFGEFNLVSSALGLGLQLFVAGFTAAQLRYYSEAEARGVGEQFTRETMRWALLATSVLTGLIILGSAISRIMGFGVYGMGIVLSGIGWLFAMAARNVLMSRVQAQRRQAAYARLQVIEALIVLACTVIALKLAPRLEAFMLGQTFAVIILLGLIIATEKGAASILRIHGPANAGLLSRAWTYGSAFAPMSVMNWIANLGDRYTLAFLLGSETTGRYVAPFSLASRPMGLASGALCDLFRPILFDAENRGDSRHAERTFAGWIASSVVLGAAGIALIYFAGGLITRLLLAPEYRDQAVNIMLWVSLGYAFWGVTGVVENRLLSLGHSGRVILPMMLGAFANVALSFVLIRLHGIVGAAQATCGSFVLQNLATIGLLFHALRSRGLGNAQERRNDMA